MKKLIGSFIIVFLLLASLTALAAPADNGPRAVAVKLWPLKADWLGQKVGFFPAKLDMSASYLLVFAQPGQATDGAEQLFFARTLIGKTYTIQGLYELATGSEPVYYWRLDGPAGEPPVWVKDSRDGKLANLPFVLDREIAEENNQLAVLQSLAGKVVWINRNRIGKGELSANIRHLSPLTVTGFKSAGIFSETYSMTFEQEDGKPLVWQLGLSGERAAFSHSQFLQLFQQGFLSKDPMGLYPQWPSSVWDLVKGREIRLGWDKDMVLMSWGEADDHELLVIGADKGLEKWRYPEGFRLYFKGKQLVKIKAPKPIDSKNKGQPPKTEAKPATGKDKDAKDDDLMEVPGATKEKKLPEKTGKTKEAD